ncbi:hypothetical protein RYB01_16445 [Pseudomonas syringae]|nr:hypothetical protein [Pseudomonas syringae]
MRQTVPATPAPPSRLENVLTTVNTITGVLQLVPAFHHVVNRNGTVTYRDGRIQSADGQTLTHPDGAMQNVDGTTEHADGSIENANGDVLHKDGTWVLADGSISYPDGRWKLTDGRIIDAQGNVLGIAAPDAQL